MRYAWQFLSVLTLVVLVLYAPSRENGFLFEDETVLKPMPESPALADYFRAGVDASAEMGWRPVWRWSLMAQRGMAGLHAPEPYRVVNIFLALAVGFLAYALMRQGGLGIRRVPGFFAVMLLVVHPVTSASVYRITDGRAVLLATAFMLGSVTLYLRGGRWNTAGAVLAFALALGSHAQALWLPLVLAAAEGAGLVWMGAARNSDQNGDHGPSHLKVVPPSQPGMARWLRLAPFLAVALIYLAARMALLGGLVAGDPVGSRAPFFEWLYAWQVLAAPSRMVAHEPPVISWVARWHFLFGVIFFLCVTAAVAAAFHHPEATPPSRRWAERRRLAFWGVWLVAAMPAMANAMAGGELFDEGDALFFSVAVWGLLAWSVSRFWEWAWIRREGIVVAVAAVVVLGGVSLGRQDYYRDDGTFISHWARSNPEAWRIFARRAAAWTERGFQEAADRQIERGLMLRADALELLQLKSSSRERAGRLEEALEVCQRMAALTPTNWTVREKVADLTFQLGRHRDAADLYRTLADALPENETIRAKLEAANRADRGEAP